MSATNDQNKSARSSHDGVVRIFLSCVSMEFRSYRLKLANHLGALPGQPYEVKVQEDFQQGGYTLLDALADYIRDCDIVIHIVGEAAGARPTAEHGRALMEHLGEPDDAPLPDRSYTQWEYHLAQRFTKRTFVYFAQPETPRDCHVPVTQIEEDERLQRAHHTDINTSGQHWKPIRDVHHFIREVFHDLGHEPDFKPNNLPLKSLGNLFKGRDEFLERIRAALGTIEHRGHRRVAAITASASAATVHGLGGIGKTRVAIQYAHRFADEYTALLFVTADSPLSLKQHLADLCGVLVLPQASTPELDVRADAALRWMQQHPGWLLIIDNVDTEESAREVEALLGRLQAAGQVLITARIGGWSGAVESLSLDVLTEADAADFLLARTDNRRRKTPDDEEHARTVASTLGQLALALEQAGAYIAEHRQTFPQYIEAWRVQHDKVLDWFDERAMQYPRSVAVTWQTSFEQLSEASRRMLNRLAWFAPDPIPESLMDVPILGAEEEDQREALADLETYALVTRDAELPQFAVHRLVQDVTRRTLRDDTEHNALKEALQWIALAFQGDPQDVRTWPTLDPLAPHGRAVVGHADKAEVPEPTASLMNRLGILLNSKALHAEAEPLYRRALAIHESSYGPDDKKVATSLNNFADLLRGTNRLHEAELLYRRALAINEFSYGPQDPEVATILNNLAALLHESNRLAEAELLYRRSLAINESSYGPDHPTVATNLNNLALLLRDMNRLSEAEPLMRRALAIDESFYCLDLDHPNVAKSLINLANLLRASNRMSEAEPLMRRGLAINESSYGSDHPTVAKSLSNLALLLQDTNRLLEAEPLFRRALAIDETSYGPDHPTVAIKLNNLALLFLGMKRLSEAEPLIRRALLIDESSYGPDHPNVAAGLHNLAGLLLDSNRASEASPLSRRALIILLKFTKEIGHEHPQLRKFVLTYGAILVARKIRATKIRSGLTALLRKYGVSLNDMLEEE